jgi:hypothetical protein
MRSIYRGMAVTIRGRAGSAIGPQLELAGAQAEVDATGRANDILKRIKVSVPIPIDGDPLPEYALQSAKTQCKRYIFNPSTVAPVWFPGPDYDRCNPLQPLSDPN